MMTLHYSRRILLSGAAVLMALSVTSTTALAQDQNTNSGHPPFRGRGMGPGMAGPWGGPMGMLLGRGAARLGLSDAQVSQIKSLAQANKTEMQALMKQLFDARRAVLTAQINGQSDAQIQQLWPAVATAESQLMMAETHIIAQAMQVLTTDQQNTLKQMIQGKTQQ